MSQFSNSIVDIHYQQTGAATAVNPLGMREMQALAYARPTPNWMILWKVAIPAIPSPLTKPVWSVYLSCMKG